MPTSLTAVAPPFHPGELAAQDRWGTPGLWDTARRQRLLWDHPPPKLNARIEGAPFFFLGIISPGTGALGAGALFPLLPDCRRAVRVDIEQVVPNCAQHIPLLVPAP